MKITNRTKTINYALLMKRVLIVLSLLTLLTIISALTIKAQTSEEIGLQIIEEADTRDSGFGDFAADMEMILRNKNGDISRRVIHVTTLEVLDDGDKSLVIFDRPRDVKGTAFLSFTHVEGQDDQWLFLPALKRVKRISSNNKSGPFMGSEFAYEDISSQEVEKYRYKYLRDEQQNGVDCFVVERYPTDKKSGYTKQIVWLDKDEYRIQRIDFYDRKESLLKTLTYSGYQQYIQKHWRADVMQMVNHQTGKSTKLEWKNYEFKTGLSDRDFDKNSLKRAR